MAFKELTLADCAKKIIDNRGKTCPVGDTGMPLIATNCVKNDLLYPAYETTRFVSDSTYETWFRGHPDPGDIIFVTKGSPGRVCLAPNPVDFCIAQDMVSIRADDEKIYPKYLFAALRSAEIQHRIEIMHVGTMIPHFKKGDFDKLWIPIPSRPQQVVVGDTYFELSARIELLRRTNITLEAIAQALFKSWFIDFDPVHAKVEGREPDGVDAATAALFPDSFEDSALGPIPQGWGVGSLSNYSDLNALSWSNKNHPAILRYLDLSNVKDNRIDTVSDYVFADAPSRARRILRRGDTIVGTVRPGNRSFAYVADADAALTGSTGFAVLSPKATTTREFVYLAATCDSNIERLANLADGGAYPAVRPELVSATTTVLPTDSVLDAFSAIASPLFAKQNESSAMQRNLSQLRDTLLPRLISGKLRLPDAQALIEEATP